MDALLVELPNLRRRLLAARPELAPTYRRIAAALKAGSDGARTPWGAWRSPVSVTLDPMADLPPSLLGVVAEVEGALDGYDVVDRELWFNEGGRVFPHNDAAFWLRTGRALGLQLWLMLDAVDWTRDGCVDAAEPGGLVAWPPAVRGLLFPFVPHVITEDGTAPPPRAEPVRARAVGDVLLFKNGVVHDKPRRADPTPTLRAALGLRLIRTADRSLLGDPGLLRWFTARVAREPELVAGMERSPYYRDLLTVLDPTPVDRLPDKVDGHDLSRLADDLRAAFSGAGPRS